MRLIDADEYEKRIKPYDTEDVMDKALYNFAHMKLISTPSAERRGRWIMHIDDLFPAESTMECDQCHAEQPLTCDDNYCPNCGADMKGERIKSDVRL